jgi:hypothetical protein
VRDGGLPCFRSIVRKRLWAAFHYALSISSVKVVRHKNAEFSPPVLCSESTLLCWFGATAAGPGGTADNSPAFPTPGLVGANGTAPRRDA